MDSSYATRKEQLMTQCIRLAAIADLHCPRTPPDIWQSVFSRVTQDADVLLLGGDLTDHGRPEEAHLLAQALTAAAVTIPVIAVLGNHDYEAGQPEEVNQILSAAGVHMLDGDICEIQGIGFAGVKGFGGGFGQASLQPWGENAIKQFVEEAVGEAMKLESALAKLRTPQRIALLHYAPIRDTVTGESTEIFPFLGSSRLEEPLNRYAVTAAFHGHAHQGSLEGRTTGGTAVYNVAAPLLQKVFPDRPPFHIVDIQDMP
jgi:Icc-related predicted phosphoesterase